MRPDMSDILGGIQRVLMEEILPDLSTDQGRERLTSVLFLLQHCMSHWDGVLPFMREEYDDLRGTLGRIAAENVGGEASGEIAEILEGIRALEEGDPAQALSFDALREALASRRDRASLLVKKLAAMDLDEGSALGRVRRDIYGHIRRQLPRNRAWVQAGEIVW